MKDIFLMKLMVSATLALNFCGKDKLKIEPQCLLSSGNLRVGLVTGQQG